MGRKVSQLISVLILAFYGSQVFSMHVVFDATNAEKFGSMIIQGKNQINELQGMAGKLQSMNQMLGINSPRLLNFSNQATAWSNYLYNFGSLNGDSLSLLNTLGYQRAGHHNYRDLMEMSDFIKSKLFPSTDSVLSGEQWETIKIERTKALEKASTGGFALSGKNKHEIRDIQKKVAELASDGMRAPTVMEALIINNQLLSVIAAEMVQQRELLSQQLELMSAVVAQGTSMINPSKSH